MHYLQVHSLHVRRSEIRVLPGGELQSFSLFNSSPHRSTLKPKNLSSPFQEEPLSSESLSAQKQAHRWALNMNKLEKNAC